MWLLVLNYHTIFFFHYLDVSYVAWLLLLLVLNITLLQVLIQVLECYHDKSKIVE